MKTYLESIGAKCSIATTDGNGIQFSHDLTVPMDYGLFVRVRVLALCDDDYTDNVSIVILGMGNVLETTHTLTAQVLNFNKKNSNTGYRLMIDTYRSFSPYADNFYVEYTEKVKNANMNEQFEKMIWNTLKFCEKHYPEIRKIVESN